jgi:Putative auto-transporter adhesin, head GIN domain
MKLVGLSLTVFLWGCSGLAVTGSGTPASEARTVGAFSSVDSESTLDVSIRQGETPSVELHVDANLLPLITTRIVGNTLVIDSKENIEPKTAGPDVIITVPRLDRAELGGDGQLTMSGWTSDSAIELVLSGSGDIHFDGAAPSVRADLSGSGRVILNGSVDQVDIDLSGSGEVEGKSLSAMRGNASLSGSGNIAASIAGPADVSLSGAGNIDLYGHPQIAHYSNTGSGQLNVH